MEDRSLLSRSTCWICFRRATKWLLSFSAASVDSLGAHRLYRALVEPYRASLNARLAVRDVSLHLVQVNLSDCLYFRSQILMQRHDVTSDGLLESQLIHLAKESAHPVSLLVVFVLNNEDHVETRQDGSLKVDVL
jgi:hypothetical protein